jgi:His-Xaa-Ser system protein HxsD
MGMAFPGRLGRHRWRWLPRVAQDPSEPIVTEAPIELRWSADTVESEAIQRATYALSRSCTTEIVRDGDDWVIKLFARSGTDAEVIAHRFRQEVVDQSLRISISCRTEPLRNAVFAMAFSRLPAATDKSDG